MSKMLAAPLSSQLYNQVPSCHMQCYAVLTIASLSRRRTTDCNDLSDVVSSARRRNSIYYMSVVVVTANEHGGDERAMYAADPRAVPDTTLFTPSTANHCPPDVKILVLS